MPLVALRDSSYSAPRKLRARLGYDKDFKGLDAGFKDLTFFREVLGTLFEVGDVFSCFGENRCL